MRNAKLRVWRSKIILDEWLGLIETLEFQNRPKTGQNIWSEVSQDGSEMFVWGR